MKLTPLLGAASLAAIASVAAAQDSGLMVLDYPGFEEPSFHAAYAAKWGMEPTFSFFGDEEEAFQKIRSGFQADVAHICAGSVTKWVESGILQPWDTSKIPEFGNLNKDLTGESVAGSGDVYFIPTDYGATAVAYNPDQVPAADVESLQVFKDPKYAGRMTLPDNVDDAYALAYLATGVTNWTNVTDDQFNAASQWLRDVHPNLVTYWTDPAELAQMLSSGQVVIGWAWNETYPTMKDEGRPIVYDRNTKEGSSIWLCGYVNLKDGPGPVEKRYDYINAMIDPASAGPLLAAGFGTSNTKGMDGISPDEVEAGGLGPVTVPVLAQLPISNDQREKQAETFEMIKTGF